MTKTRDLADLANGITSANIVDGAVTNADINSSAAIAKTKISGTAITAADTGTVTSTMIADGTIVNADINASAGITSSKLAFTQSGTGAVQRTVESKLQDVVSVLDFIPPSEHAAIKAGTSTYNATAAIQAAIDAHSTVFLPAGTYLISGPITLGGGSAGNRTLYGESQRDTTIKATSASACLVNETSHYFIRLEKFTFDGNNVATKGISLGVPGGSTGSAAYDTIDTVHVNNCVSDCIRLNSLQYSKINKCLVSGAANGYGINAIFLLSSSITNTVVIDNKTGMYLGNKGGASSGSYGVYLNNVEFFGPYAVGTSPDGYLVIDGAYSVFIDNCVFEEEKTHTTPLVSIDNTNGSIVTGNIFFNECQWTGLAFANDKIRLNAGSRIFFDKCRSIRPASGNFILNNVSAQSVYVNDCFAGISYTDSSTLYWTTAGWTTGAITESRSEQSLFRVDLANNRIGTNNPPEYLHDFNLPIGQSGIFARLYGGNNNSYNNRGLASHFLFSVSSTGVNPNRGIKFDLNGQDFSIDGTYHNGSTYVQASDVLIRLNPGGGVTESAILRPNVDNTHSLGTAPRRWSVVYAGTGTINTSDERQKQDIEDLSDTELRVATALKGLVKKFRFKDAIQAKDDDARIHVGVIAQEVIAAFQAEGLDPMRYGMICYDKWEPKIDEKGNETEPGGDRYGVRYEELLAFIIAAL